MEFFRQNTKIDFMAQRFKCALLSLILFILSIISLCVYGLNLGLDFTGGTQVQLHYAAAPDLNTLRSDLARGGFHEAIVQNYGSMQDVLITLRDEVRTQSDVRESETLMQQNITDKIHTLLPQGTVQQVNYIGPTVGHELASKGILGIIVAMICTMIYIAFRFEYRFALSSTLALIHDPILILGIFSFWQVQFDLVTLAAVLTVIGYSLNDTIVVFDRVRENFRKLRKGTPLEIMNYSLNQTLSRTVMTSGMTLLAVLALYLFGGPVLHGFSLAFLIGIVVGTYSSIYVAGALALAFGLKRQDLLPAEKKYQDNRA